jgi:hypothetical protein
MVLTELLPAIHALPHADKLRLMQVLVADIAHKESFTLPPTDLPHTVWAPYDAYGAAATLQKVLNEDQFTTGYGDYTQDKEHLFGAMTVDEVAQAILKQKKGSKL